MTLHSLVVHGYGPGPLLRYRSLVVHQHGSVGCSKGSESYLSAGHARVRRKSHLLYERNCIGEPDRVADVLHHESVVRRAAESRIPAERAVRSGVEIVAGGATDVHIRETHQEKTSGHSSIVLQRHDDPDGLGAGRLRDRLRKRPDPVAGGARDLDGSNSLAHQGWCSPVAAVTIVGVVEISDGACVIADAVTFSGRTHRDVLAIERSHELGNVAVYGDAIFQKSVVGAGSEVVRAGAGGCEAAGCSFRRCLLCRYCRGL